MLAMPIVDRPKHSRKMKKSFSPGFFEIFWCLFRWYFSSYENGEYSSSFGWFVVLSATFLQDMVGAFDK